MYCGGPRHNRRSNPFVSLADNLALRQAVNDLQVRLEAEQQQTRQLSREVRGGASRSVALRCSLSRAYPGLRAGASASSPSLPR